MANTSYLVSGRIGGNLTTPFTPTASTVPDPGEGVVFGLGDIADTNNAGKAIYASAAEAIDAGNYVTIDEDFAASKGTKAAVDDGHTIGIATTAFASGDLGWFLIQTRGGVGVKVATACAADVPLYTSSVAGVLDDSSTSQTLIKNIVITSANAAGAAAVVECIATYPSANLGLT